MDTTTAARTSPRMPGAEVIRVAEGAIPDRADGKLILTLALLLLAPAPTGAAALVSPSPIMQLTKLTGHSAARCLDGSPGSYYYTTGRSADKFLIFLAGGGWCYPSAALWTPEDTDSNCLWRSKGGLGSSLKLAPSRNRPGGMLSAEHAQSPFADYSLLLVNYCESLRFGLRLISMSLLRSLLPAVALNILQVTVAALLGSEPCQLSRTARRSIIVAAQFSTRSSPMPKPSMVLVRQPRLYLAVEVLGAPPRWRTATTWRACCRQHIHAA
jgi:hypothetical protein